MRYLQCWALVIASSACLFAMSANAQAVVEMRYVDEDEIAPSLVEHRCEELFEGDQLVQIYNYVYYEFHTQDHFYWARSYLDEIEEVSIFGPFGDATRQEELDDPIDTKIIAYFRRRYALLRQLGEEGYEPIP